MNAGDMDKLHNELIAYLEGELPAEERDRVERAIAESGEARAELDWLRSAYADIEAVERGASLPVGDIDIVDHVMQSVRKASATANVVPLEPKRSRMLRYLPALAAAAAVIVAIGYMLLSNPEQKHPSKNGHDGNKLASKPPAKLPADLAKSKERLDKQTEELRHAVEDKTNRTVETQQTPAPKLILPGGIDDVVAARRDATMPGATMEKLVEWARLAKTDALKVADSNEASADAILGAAQSLSGDDRRRVLLTAVGKLEDNPNGRFQLAMAYMTDPPADPAAAEQNQVQAATNLSDVKALDPENALPYYYEAKLALDNNDTASALTSLEAASALSKANAYSLESALAQAEALKAAGMEPDAARMVAALTAGVDENNFLCQLASDLLKSGQGLLSENDLAAGEAIFKAVEEFGRQVEEGASFSQEQVAGIDIQRQALGELGQFYTTVESADGVASVTEATNALTVDVENLTTFFNALDELFVKPMTTSFWNMVSGIILGSGDMSLFSNPEVSTVVSPATTP